LKKEPSFPTNSPEIVQYPIAEMLLTITLYKTDQMIEPFSPKKLRKGKLLDYNVMRRSLSFKKKEKGYFI
jgi:hypothetical protein